MVAGVRERSKPLDPPEPAVRYCRPHAGDLVHLDTRKLGRIGVGGGKRFGGRRDRYRGIGWNYAHVAVDDATRLEVAGFTWMAEPGSWVVHCSSCNSCLRA
jgi:hypothetical protein